ncbi:MAG TPA: PaaI family thioesterase [Kineosporiaceae bacterium]|nr:PaaI family thioesterase [Kineosporiaceae bacterium]
MSQTQLDGVRRHREYSWTDPAATVAALSGSAGIEVLQAMAAGHLPAPPVMHTLDIQAVAFEVGRAVFSLVPAEMHYNPLGTVHGGVIATLLDSAAGCAVHSILPLGSGYTSVDLNTKFLRAVSSASGRITAEGVVLNRGGRTALAQATLTDERGRLLAHATSTCLIFELPNGVTAPTGGGGA